MIYSRPMPTGIHFAAAMNLFGWAENKYGSYFFWWRKLQSGYTIAGLLLIPQQPLLSPNNIDKDLMRTSHIQQNTPFLCFHPSKKTWCRSGFYFLWIEEEEYVLVYNVHNHGSKAYATYKCEEYWLLISTILLTDFNHYKSVFKMYFSALRQCVVNSTL